MWELSISYNTKMRSRVIIFPEISENSFLISSFLVNNTSLGGGEQMTSHAVLEMLFLSILQIFDMGL